MLSFNHVEFSYSDQQVFTDLNFQLEHGEFACLIGKSGAGKSTLIQLVYMNILPSSGYLQVGEFDSKTIKPGMLPLLRRKLGVVFQDFRLLSDRNIFENLSFVLEATNSPRKEVIRKVNNALTDVGLSHRRRSMPKELSGGEKQRIALARALMNEPKLILPMSRLAIWMKRMPYWLRRSFSSW